MTLYPWRQYGKNTTEEIASQVESQWETPGGAQQKADQAEENAKKYADENFAKNAFSKVASPGRATVESEDKEDTLTLEAGTGIAITTDPAQKKVTIWTQGDSAPGVHGETHNHDGSDPIPDLVQLRDDYEQNAVKKTGDQEMLGELTLHKFNIGNAEWTTVHSITFGENENEKLDIEIPKDKLFGTLEITVNGSFTTANASGNITKVIHVALRESGQIDTNESYYTQVSRRTANHFAISDVIFDPVKDKYVIKIAHRSTYRTITKIIVRGRVASVDALNTLKQITFSDIYTTDTTQYEQPYRTGVIIESGENANGHYVRFADGTFIAYSRVTRPADELYVEYTAPMRGISGQEICAFAASQTTSNPDRLESAGMLNVRVEGSGWGTRLSPNFFVEGETIRLDLILIGRWM